MMKGDEREERIHIESARNGFVAYTFATISFWLHNIIQTGQASWSLYVMAFGPFFVFVVSVIYYHQTGLKKGLGLSVFGSD